MNYTNCDKLLNVIFNIIQKKEKDKNSNKETKKGNIIWKNFRNIS